MAAIGGRFIDRLTELRSASEQLSDSLPIWDSYLFPYWRNVADVARLVGSLVWLVLALGIGLLLVRSLRRSMVLGGLLALGVLLAVRAASRSGEFHGGTVNVALSQVALPLLLALAGVVWLVAHVAASMPSDDPDRFCSRVDPGGPSSRCSVGDADRIGRSTSLRPLEPSDVRCCLVRRTVCSGDRDHRADW